MKSDDPFYQRPQKWDKHLKKWRRQAWDEIDEAQKDKEWDYMLRQNRKLRARLAKAGVES